MDLTKVIEQTLGVKTKDLKVEEVHFSEKLMKEAVKESFKELNSRIGILHDARDGFEEGYNQGISDVRVSVKKILQDL